MLQGKRPSRGTPTFWWLILLLTSKLNLTFKEYHDSLRIINRGKMFINKRTMEELFTNN